MRVKVQIVSDETSLDPWVEPWRDLATSAGNPFAAPDWWLAWWRHAASPSDQLRVVLATERGRLVAGLPLGVRRSRTGLFHYRLIGSEAAAGVEPVLATTETSVIAAVAAALSRYREPPVDVLRLEGISSNSPWAEDLSRDWVGKKPWYHLERVETVPLVETAHGSYQDWLCSKSTNFQKQARRLRRRLEDEGFRPMVRTGESLVGHFEAFWQLCKTRWKAAAIKSWLPSGHEAALEAAALAFEKPGSMQLWTLERPGDTAAADLYLSAGRSLFCWMGAIDERWARFQPGIQLMLSTFEQSWGDYDHIDLGPGGQAYKLRLANSVTERYWCHLIGRSISPLHTPAQLIPWPLRHKAAGVATQLILPLAIPARDRALRVAEAILRRGER